MVEIEEILGEFSDKVDCIVSSSKAKIGVPSTIMMVKDGKLEVLREGPISFKELINRKDR